MKLYGMGRAMAVTHTVYAFGTLSFVFLLRFIIVLCTHEVSMNKTCDSCKKSLSEALFTGHGILSEDERRYYHIDKILLCDSCLGSPHRPLQLRIKAGLIVGARQAMPRQTPTRTDDTNDILFEATYGKKE